MIKSLTFTNFLDESIEVVLKEAEPSHGLLIRSVEGIGPVTAQLNSIAFVTSDGEMYNSARRLVRNIVLNLIFTGTDIEKVRHETYKYFPEKKYITVKVETDHRLAEAYGYVERNEPTIFSDQEGCQISIICMDPNFYDCTGKGYQSTKFYGIIPLFEFPFSNESLTVKLIEFGDLDFRKERIINYIGEVETGFVFNIHFVEPTVKTLIITNVDTGEKMTVYLHLLSGILGRPIMAKDDLIISSVNRDVHVTYVSRGVATNVFNIVDKNSDWFEIVKGENRFTFTCGGDEPLLEIEARNKIVYRGM